MIKKYKKKPVVIEAIQYNGENFNYIVNWINENWKDSRIQGVSGRVDWSPGPPPIDIETLEGTMIADVGDFIIKGIEGEFYPCKPDIFKKTYQEVGE